MFVRCLEAISRKPVGFTFLEHTGTVWTPGEIGQAFVLNVLVLNGKEWDGENWKKALAEIPEKRVSVLFLVAMTKYPDKASWGRKGSLSLTIPEDAIHHWENNPSRQQRTGTGARGQWVTLQKGNPRDNSSRPAASNSIPPLRTRLLEVPPRPFQIAPPLGDQWAYRKHFTTMLFSGDSCWQMLNRWWMRHTGDTLWTLEDNSSMILFDTTVLSTKTPLAQFKSEALLCN